MAITHANNELINKIKSQMIIPGIHLTFVTSEGVSTFSNDNSKYLDMWWLLQKEKLSRNPDYYVVLHKREFTKLIDEKTKFPVKKISSCLFLENSVFKMTASETKKAFHTDANSGKKLPRMTDAIFIDFEF